jgi:hypothetical protein
MDGTWQLAQINVGTLVADADDPVVQPFMDALAEINALAESSRGFVWRLKDDVSGGATSIAVAADPRFIVNMSVWESAEALFEFVYRSAHTSIMARRREFFTKPPEDRAYQVLWWVPAGTEPTIADGLAKLWHLDRFGPTSLAFTFKQRFAPPGDVSSATSEVQRLVSET